jgi:DNA-binding MarR family transcriptional regulator
MKFADKEGCYCSNLWKGLSLDQTQFAILYDSLRSITHCLDIHSRLLHRQIGVTVPQFSILLALSHESPLSVSNLSQKIHLSSSTISVMSTLMPTVHCRSN